MVTGRCEAARAAVPQGTTRNRARGFRPVGTPVPAAPYHVPYAARRLPATRRSAEHTGVMHRAVTRWTAFAAVLGPLAAGACASGGAAPPSGVAPSAAEFEEIYRARADSARMRYTPADVRFMGDMIAHHAQAVEMARMAPTHGASPAVQRLAARIVAGQVDEIAIIQRWLRDRGEPVPDLHAAHAHAAHMPGMVSPEQLRELDRARGAEFDRLFLARMIEHHRGAVAMVNQLFATDGAGQDEQVFRFASDVQVDQATEIARMERMLAAMAPAGGAR